MTWAETLRTAWEAIRTRRMRSALTMLGILIGIAAVMLTVGLGQGASEKVTEQISALGSNLLVVSPGSSTAGGVRGGRGTATTLTVTDATALANPAVAPDIANVAPVSTSQQSVLAGSQSWTTSIVGTTPAWEQVRARTTADGRFFSQAEADSGAQEAVIGSTTASQLFGNRSPIGDAMTINGQDFTVIGVLNTVGSGTTGDEDDQVVIPFQAYALRVATTANTNQTSTIYVAAKSQDTLSAAYQETNQTLLTTHAVTADTADFTISSQQALMTTVTSTTRILTILLGGVAGISLLVGGIGVMNIMLVSVTERIREIGLRKALGATPGTVLRQFLVEASVLGLLGGVLGLALGIVGALILPSALGQPVLISPVAAAAALLVSLAIGITAGVYPAGRAARLAPIDALRSE
ncbi:MAG: ABC transporter permease [Actinobacteria bacterium]|nr:ABC transporter permease [Actinomycetota bacterium]